MADKFLVIDGSSLIHRAFFCAAAADYASGHPYGSSLRPVQYAAEAFR